MERYFPVVSKASSSSNYKPKCDSRKYQPYRPNRPSKMTCSDPIFPVQDSQQKDVKYSSVAMTKFLLETLSDEANPITHSDIGQRSDYVFSTCTGHQVSEGQRKRKFHLEDREHKLATQRAECCNGETQLLRNVRIYINGFLNNTTDIEMKKIVLRAGGQILPTASGCTHILTSQQLSRLKSHKFLNSRPRKMIHIVKPEWVFDSIKSGKRRPEREYEVIKNSDDSSSSLIDYYYMPQVE